MGAVCARARVRQGVVDDFEELFHPAAAGHVACDWAAMRARSRVADIQQVRPGTGGGVRDLLAQPADAYNKPRAARDCPIGRDIEIAAAATTSTARE